MSTSTMSNNCSAMPPVRARFAECRWAFRAIVPIILLICWLLPSQRLYAQGAPAVDYNPAINTIFIGSAAGVPGSQTITFPALATAVGNEILVNQGNGVWFSRAKIEILATARLEVAQSESLTELRLESTTGKVTFIKIKDGGQLLLNGVKVTSWDASSETGAVDDDITDGRAYILAQEGSRMDILTSDIAYLGDATNTTTSGVALTKRAIPGDPSTGSTGTIQGSKFHNNYQGLFVSEGISLTITNNEVFDNLNDGIYLRDGTTLSTVSGNTVRNNGNQNTGSGSGIRVYNNSTQNTVVSNNVSGNAGNGISVERGSNNNQVRGNTVTDNTEGIVVAESDNNLIQGNTARNNQNGIRISGAQDNPAANNQVIGNQVQDSQSTTSNAYGIYFYNHADSNTIRNNTILRSATYGIYIKSGGNRIEGNTIRDGKTGIAIVGEEESIGEIPLLELSGRNNVVISSTITGNSDIGIRIEGGVLNGIGATPGTGAPLPGNVIQNNGGNGIFIKNTSAGFSSTDNQVVGNRIHSNGSAGIVVKDPGSDRNRLSNNSITDNAGSGIKVDNGAQGGILPPVIDDVLADGVVLGTAAANATIEIYNDPGSEGETRLGTAPTNDAGAWSFQLPAGQDSKRVTALVIAGNGNTSAFSGVSGSTVELFTTVGVDGQNQQLININGPGAIATLADIQTLLGATYANLLENQGNGIWQLNANLKLEREVTLNLTPDTGVTELKLRSNPGTTVTGTVDYNSFVYLRTHNGVINIDGIKITGWDTVNNKADDNMADGRAFIIAKFGAELNIRNAEISYLGTPDNSESHGVTWRDDSAVNAAGLTRTQVAGTVENSKFHHNFNGVQIIQAGDMTFTGNEFHSNLNYGFYARDNSRDTLLENNLVYNNASHGIMLARGITSFVLRGNKAYSNGNGGAAHGIVVSYGSPPRSASVENLLENNEAYSNGGYGINVEGSNNNQLIGNLVYENSVGINLEDGSTANIVNNNTARANRTQGIQIRLDSNNNTFTGNTATENTNNGFYVRSSGNRLENNAVSANLAVGINLNAENAIALATNQLISNSVRSNASHGLDIRESTGTVVTRNRVEGNGVHGIYLTGGAVDTQITQNIIAINNDTGIRVNEVLSYQNHWSENAIYDNKTAAINLAGGANNGIIRPKITEIDGRFVNGDVRTPGATIEIFTDDQSQGRYFIGSGEADGEGNFAIFISGSFVEPGVVAVATDADGNSSEFSDPFVIEDVNPAILIFLPVVAR